MIQGPRNTPPLAKNTHFVAEAFPDILSLVEFCFPRSSPCSHQRQLTITEQGCRQRRIHAGRLQHGIRFVAIHHHHWTLLGLPGAAPPPAIGCWALEHPSLARQRGQIRDKRPRALN